MLIVKKKKKMNKYCSYCGDEMIPWSREDGFDVLTGERRYKTFRGCKKGLADMQRNEKFIFSFLFSDFSYLDHDLFVSVDRKDIQENV